VKSPPLDIITKLIVISRVDCGGTPGYFLFFLFLLWIFVQLLFCFLLPYFVYYYICRYHSTSNYIYLISQTPPAKRKIKEWLDFRYKYISYHTSSMKQSSKAISLNFIFHGGLESRSTSASASDVHLGFSPLYPSVLLHGNKTGESTSPVHKMVLNLIGSS